MSDAPDPSLQVDGDCLAAYSLGMSIKRVQIIIGFTVEGESLRPHNQVSEDGSIVRGDRYGLHGLVSNWNIWSQLFGLARNVESCRHIIPPKNIADYDRSAKAFLRIRQEVSGRLPRSGNEVPDETACARLMDAWKLVDDLEITVRSILQTLGDTIEQWFDLGLQIPDVKKFSFDDRHIEALAPAWDLVPIALCQGENTLSVWFWRNLSKIVTLFETLNVRPEDLFYLAESDGHFQLQSDGQEWFDTFHLIVWEKLTWRLNDLLAERSDVGASEPRGDTPAAATLTEPERRPAYYRDHYWLDRQLNAGSDEEGKPRLRPAEIRDLWNAMPEVERKSISPGCFNKIGQKRTGMDTVRKHIKMAREEREQQSRSEHDRTADGEHVEHPPE
jgi:hypothetical protein